MKIKLFAKQNCPRCPMAKKLCEELKDKIKTEIYMVDDVEGLAEASFHEVTATPTLVIVDQQDREIKSFRGITPSKEEILVLTDAN